MKLVLLIGGLLVGLAAGVAAVVAFAIASDQDIRDVVAKARRNVESIDFDAIGAHVKEEITEAEERVQASISDANAMADQASGNGRSKGETDAAAEAKTVASA